MYGDLAKKQKWKHFGKNPPCDIGILGDNVSLQNINQVFVLSSSVKPLHLHLYTLRFVLQGGQRVVKSFFNYDFFARVFSTELDTVANVFEKCHKSNITLSFKRIKLQIQQTFCSLLFQSLDKTKVLIVKSTKETLSMF